MKTLEACTYSVYMNCHYQHVRHTCMSNTLVRRENCAKINQSIEKRKTPGSVNNHSKTDNPYIVVTKCFKITLHVYLVCHTIFLNGFQQR